MVKAWDKWLAKQQSMQAINAVTNTRLFVSSDHGQVEIIDITQAIIALKFLSQPFELLYHLCARPSKDERQTGRARARATRVRAV